jgi:NAD(P)-dependent dehydrogenase (short-subunit alcohol dehydrogenase family)
VSEELFDKIVGLIFKGPFRLASQVARRMAEGEGGVIINVSATGALMPTPGIVPYGCSKAALNAMGVSFAHEYGPKVRVNTISPGVFLTDMAKGWSQERREHGANALGRNAQPSELATTALYLASPASSFTTGALIRVDGGV